ncbi:hypothetical protein [Rhizobium leguminosarum]|uniref:hypothetical protein n=1 Tax=Rhizobium acaciae TaxID=2989736 RepID=UPI0002F6C327
MFRAMKPAGRRYVARLSILPSPVTKPEKSRIMPGHIDPRIRESSATDLSVNLYG